MLRWLRKSLYWKTFQSQVQNFAHFINRYNEEWIYFGAILQLVVYSGLYSNWYKLKRSRKLEIIEPPSMIHNHIENVKTFRCIHEKQLFICSKETIRAHFKKSKYWNLIFSKFFLFITCWLQIHNSCVLLNNITTSFALISLP